MQSDKATDSLLESIRKELNTIINEGEAKAPPKNLPPSKDVKTKPKTSKSATAKKHVKTDESIPTSAKSSSTANGSQGGASKKIKYLPPELVEQLSQTENAKRAEFLNDQMAKTIDENVQKMTVDLKDSYELFTSINERFQSINFGNLKSRIKSLHLGATNNAGSGVEDEVKEMLEKSFMEKRLHTITSDMTEKLRNHPGEFGDIPEVSEFFKACSQLQNGLKKLKKQREDANALEKQLAWATEVSYERAEELRKAITKDRTDSDDDDNGGAHTTAA